jgi:hypothetical protein
MASSRNEILDWARLFATTTSSRRQGAARSCRDRCPLFPTIFSLKAITKSNYPHQRKLPASLRSSSISRTSLSSALRPLLTASCQTAHSVSLSPRPTTYTAQTKRTRTGAPSSKTSASMRGAEPALSRVPKSCSLA